MSFTATVRCPSASLARRAAAGCAMLRACVALCARLTVWRNLVHAPSQVKWFDRKKGIGFATPAAGGDDIFIHRRNFTTQFTLDENDEVFYDVGEYEGRPTAIKISVPPDKVSKAPPRRVRGRNAKKSLDEEAETVAVEKDAEAVAEQSAPAAPAAEGAATGDKPGGGRDSKTRRRPVRCSPVLLISSSLRRLAATAHSCPHKPVPLAYVHLRRTRAIARDATTRAWEAKVP